MGPEAGFTQFHTHGIHSSVVANSKCPVFSDLQKGISRNTKYTGHKPRIRSAHMYGRTPMESVFCSSEKTRMQIRRTPRLYKMSRVNIKARAAGITLCGERSLAADWTPPISGCSSLQNRRGARSFQLNISKEGRRNVEGTEKWLQKYFASERASIGTW